MNKAVPVACLVAALLGPGGTASVSAAGFGPLSKPAPISLKRVLLVLAHPDDETMMGGTLGRFKELGVDVRAVYASYGEGGKRVVVRHGKPVEEKAPSADWLRHTRRGELARAAAHYGIDAFDVVGVPDAPTRFTDKSGPGETGAQFLARGSWDVPALERAISQAAVAFRPDIVITLLPENGKIHPHHQAIAQIARRLFAARKLGTARQLYGVEESAWYPPATFATNALEEAEKVRFDTSRETRRKGMTYAAFAARGAAHHRSQMVGYRGEVGGEEVFVALADGPNLLAALLSPAGMETRRAAKVRNPGVRKQLPKTFKVRRGGGGFVPR